MANLQLPFGIEVLNQKPADAKYFLSGETPYNSIGEVNTNVVNGIRHQGLTVNVLGTEYWYKDGIADIDLVIKGSSAIINVGSGGGEVYSGTSGSTILLRTILGSGGTTVSTVDDTIIVKGGTSNVRSVHHANTGTEYSATTSSDYIGTSVSVTLIYLPLSPPEGQQITISDEEGSGELEPITVNGNGKMIDDSSTATINTDWGSMTILYNGTIWKVISFSN